jgi:hypothetical protein
LVKIDLFGNVILEESEEIVKPNKRSPFDYVNDFSKKAYNEDLEGYNKWIINTALSMRKDTVIYANEMNKYADVSEKAQYDFYFYGMPKRNYFAKWAKNKTSDDLELIKSYYKVSEPIAKQYLQILNDDQISQIRSKVDAQQGGLRKK